MNLRTVRHLNQPINHNNPTPPQLRRIVTAQKRRAALDVDARRKRRAALRARLGKQVPSEN